MSAFPKLKTGAVAQYPASREKRHRSTVLRYVDGKEQRYRESGVPLRQWVIRLDLLEDDELEAIDRLFREVQGRAGGFEFEDPWDGSVHEDCSFDEDELEARWVREALGETALVIRENRS